MIDKLMPQYCERVSDGFWAEPLNTVSNLLFILVALILYRHIKRNKISDRYLIALPILSALVSVGSLIWHIAPSKSTLILDSLFLYSFIVWGLALLLHNLTHSWKKAGAILLLFIGFEVAATIIVPADFANGSIRHILNTGFLMLLVTILLKRDGFVHTRLFIITIVAYTSAIVFRSIDHAICPYLPIGSHFL